MPSRATPTESERRIEYMDLEELKPDPRNSKGHDLAGITALLRRGIADVAAVIDERTGLLVAGHGRRAALLELHLEDPTKPPPGVRADGDRWLVPVARGWRSRNAKEVRTFRVGLNGLTIAGGWNRAALFADLDGLDPAHLAGTGFTLAQVTGLRTELNPPPTPEGPDPAPRPAAPKVAEPGDVWTIGPHRLMVGDCRNAEHVARLLEGAPIHLAVSSPPYADRRKYDPATEFRPIHPDKYVRWLAPAVELIAEHLAADGSWVLNLKPGAKDLDRDLYVLDLVIAHVREWGWHLGDEFCWERNGVPGYPARRLKGGFEPLYHFARGEWKWRPQHVQTASSSVPVYDPTNNVQAERMQGVPGGMAFTPTPRARRANHSTESMGSMQGSGADVGAAVVEGMAYPSNRLPTFAGTHEATGHPAAYPWGLPAFFARLLTDPGDNIYDPFGGSGSTLLAAHHEHRTGYAMELSPGYVDEALARLHRDTALVPVRHDGTEYPT